MPVDVWMTCIFGGVALIALLAHWLHHVWSVGWMKNIRDLLECPVCTEDMRPPTEIFQCINGHSFCGNCKSKVRRCPTCRLVMGSRNVGRNRLAEMIAEETFGQATQEEIRRHNFTRDLWKPDVALTEEDLLKALSLVESGQVPANFIKNKAKQIRRDLAPYEDDDHLEPSKASSLVTAASMIKCGIIKNLKVLELYAIDIGSIAPEVLTSLSSVVKNHIGISFVTGKVDHILSNIKCRELDLQLGPPMEHDELQCLLEAMRTKVERLVLEPDTELDIQMFTEQYDGLGKCGEVWASKEEYLDTLVMWAKRIGWQYDGEFTFSRN